MDIGVGSPWRMIGNFAMGRYHSRDVALREFLVVSPPLRGVDGHAWTEVRAVKQGLFTEKYSLEKGA